MKIARVDSRRVTVPLTRPYAIAGGSWDSVDLLFVEITTDGGVRGVGQASPAVEVTGESADHCAAELTAERLAWLVGQDATGRDALVAEVAARITGPAARAAVDTALFDLAARLVGQPLADHLGRVHTALPTSITIGVKDAQETLAEAEEYFGRGFRVLKVKTGVDIDEDLRRLTLLRERHGRTFTLRVDANQGYDLAALRRLAADADRLDLEMIEQPLPPAEDAALWSLPATIRQRLAADESVHDERTLERFVRDGAPFGIINVKLMKCGGIAPALRLARLAHLGGLAVMWGCMDESVVGIAAALHAAFACPATRYLDLDGSFDLGSDPYRGGFHLAAGVLSTLDRPGTGVEPT